jgi:hypothetical protein
MNYNSIVSSIRSVARDYLRLQAVNRYREELLSVTTERSNRAKNHDENVMRLNKAIAYNDYQASKLEDANPYAKEDAERLAQDSQNKEEEKAQRTKSFVISDEALAKTEAEINVKIAKIQSGETKVDAENLTAEANKLIAEVTNEAVRSQLFAVMAADVPEVEPVMVDVPDQF